MGENKRIVTGVNYIRAVAITLVLVYHYFPSLLGGGFFGVDIFFTLSGYLITASIIQSFDDGIFNFGAFIKRRLTRLMPAVLFTVLFTLALTVLISPDFRVDILAQLTAAVTFTSNYYEIAQGHSYENQLLPHLFVHTWFLAVQVQLYIIWGLIAALINKKATNGRVVLLFCSVVIAVLSFIRMQAGVLTEGDNSVVYYDTLARAYPFMLGSAVGILFGFNPGKRVRQLMGWKLFKHFSRVLAIVSAAGIALLAIYMSFSDIVTYRIGMLSVSVMTVIIIIFIRTLNEKAPVNEPRIVSFIGTASYSVYLLHWPLYIIVTQLVREHGYRLSLSDRQAVACLASLLCTLPMAWLTYKYVESIPRGTRRLKRVALTIGAFMFVPSFYAVASAPKITSIEESFNYTPEEEVMPVFVVSAAENETPPPTSTDEPPRVEPTPAIQPPSDTPETQPPFITTEPEEEPTETKEPTAEPTAGQTAEPTTEPTAEPTEPIETAEQTAEPIVYPTDTPATEPDTETPAPESSTAPPLTQVAVNSSQMIGMPVPTATPVPTPAPIPVKPINSEFIDVKYEGLTLDGGVLILGDSVTLGASQVLYPLFNYVTDNNWTFEAKVSRNMKNGVTIINEYIADGRLINYKYIVLALASNIQNTTYDAIDELIQILGGDYKVIFVTGYGRDFMTEPAAYLRSLPGLYKNISVADWEKSIEGHTKELAPDGLHAGTTLSRKIYSECILDAILKTMEEREEEPPVAEPIEERKVIAP